MSRERNDFSVAYFGFEDYSTMEQFIQKFNNFTIQDEKGKSYILIVQRALYQSLPKDRKKPHPLANTYTSTDDFKQFVDKIQSAKVSKEEIKKPSEEVKEQAAQQSTVNEEHKNKTEISQDSEKLTASPSKVEE